MPWLVKRICATCGRSYRREETAPMTNPICDECAEKALPNGICNDVRVPYSQW